MALIKLLLALSLTPMDAYAATAIATCESGDTVNFGTYDWKARSVTQDGGAFQFNDATWAWLVGDGRGDTASPYTQISTFVRLYNGGLGLVHWAPSKPCWSQWITSDGKAINQAHYYAFVREYMQSYTSNGAH